jgi:hypothetical protein
MNRRTAFIAIVFIAAAVLLFAADEIERLQEQLRLSTLDAAINEARANDLELLRELETTMSKEKGD